MNRSPVCRGCAGDAGGRALQTKLQAVRSGNGFKLSGSKALVVDGHVADLLIVAARTAGSAGERDGLTLFLVDPRTKGLTTERTVMVDSHNAARIDFDNVEVDADHVLGEVDGAWKQATSELAYERSGPERFLETFYVLTDLVRVLGEKPDTRGAEGIGRLVAQVHALRRMSVSVAGMLHAGKEPVVEAAIVKDVGTIWEQKLPHKARDLAAFVEEGSANRATFEQQMTYATMIAPKLTIQGGTTEILRGIIARGLGLR